LVEQIIASHRHAAGAGELTDFPFLSQELAELLKTGREYPECVRDFDPARAQAFAKIYLNRQARFFPDARRITDKMPINFMHLGLIVHMFPRARIIHCQRDPRDICISILSQSFGGYHPYAYDQKRLAHFYGEYLRLMDHWKRVLPAKILDLKYEDMVGSTEACARRVLDFCGLDWDDDCLRFHETRRAVHTASSWQVRQPVYGSSVGRWRRFENHLSPLIREFRKLGIELDRPDSDPPRTEERIIDEP
ncbi:MAG: sulfotransferase, partial [Rhodospirillales bacterium]|nr:sulfotransferase [Rhodospirillales bacterium]